MKSIVKGEIQTILPSSLISSVFQLMAELKIEMMQKLIIINGSKSSFVSLSESSTPILLNFMLVYLRFQSRTTIESFYYHFSGVQIVMILSSWGN